ncbi:MAG: hypothetical protein WC877_01195 [Dehalococcoidales bacterium]
MQTTELIKKLQGFVETYGDHEIRVNGDVNEESIKIHVFPNEFFVLSNTEEPL